MHVVAFLTEHAVLDRIIAPLKLTFVAERPPAAGSRFPGTPLGIRLPCRVCSVIVAGLLTLSAAASVWLLTRLWERVVRD